MIDEKRIVEIQERYTEGSPQFRDIGACTLKDIRFLLGETESLQAEILAAKDASRAAQDANSEAGNTITQLMAEKSDLQDQLAESQRREQAATEKIVQWGANLIECNTDAHITFCSECGFPIADYSVDKEIFCTMCKAQNTSHHYVITGPGSCRRRVIAHER